MNGQQQQQQPQRQTQQSTPTAETLIAEGLKETGNANAGNASDGQGGGAGKDAGSAASAGAAGGDASQQQPGNDPALQMVPVTQINQIVADAITKHQQTQQQTAQQRQQRDGFIGTRLKNFPAVYAEKLGTDPAKWEAEAKAIEGQYQADAQRFGWQRASVGGDNAGGQSPAAAIQASGPKLSPVQMIEQGLNESKR